MKSIKSVNRIPPVTVHTSDGKYIGSNQGKADAIQCRFQQLFADLHHEHLEPFTGDPHPLNIPIRASETQKALHSLKNGCAADPDNINNELLEYASESILPPIVLLNCSRKVISLITQQCIQKKVNMFTNTTQGGFKQGRSCADVIWAQRILYNQHHHMHLPRTHIPPPPHSASCNMCMQFMRKW